MGDDGVDHFLVAVDDAENALGQAGIAENVAQQVRQGGITFRWLQDEGVAGGDGDAGHPHRNHRREIERGDASADADRLAEGPDVDARPGALGELALQHVRDAAAEFDHLQPALNVATAVGQHLAMFGTEHAGQFIHAGFDQFLEPEHHPGAALRVGGGPGRLRSAGGSDCLFEQISARQSHFCLHLA